jgi:hypothetical protein
MSDLPVSPVQRIEDAIQRLETLKAESTPGPWLVSPCSCGEGHFEIADEQGFYVADAAINGTDAHLIVTLHATIDAQLSLFEAAIFNIKASKHGFTHATVAAAIRLADAINADLGAVQA